MTYISHSIIPVAFLFRPCMYCIASYIHTLPIFNRLMFKDMSMECFKTKSISLNLKNSNPSAGPKEPQ